MSNSSEINIALITSENAAALHRLMVSNKVYFIRYMPKTVSSNVTLEGSARFIKNISEEALLKKQFLYTITYQAELVGLVYLKELDWENKQGEFAYCLAENFSGKGITSTAVKQLISIAFNELKLENLIIIVHKSNMGSIKVAEKCGFKHTKTLKNEFTPTGENPLDMELYELRK
ncbi:GNAT family N-acetyltransferase [Rasiella sp. SM2506]|uniref:GNAT family N-acetyltransferase n=1 Tax=Rasiella sp. SM2506 TaxID=3423914 RepID=UPI003D7A8DD0